MPAPPELVRLTDAYALQVRRIRAAVVATVGRSWASLDAHRDADIARWAELVSPVVEGGQLRTAALTDAYLARFTTLVTGEETQPLGVTADLVTAPGTRGVETTAEVYRRMGPTVWSALAEGDPYDLAVTKGANRARKVAETDLQLSKTHASRAVVEADERIVGHRRVLTGSKNCALCLTAASQRYTKENLQPIHPGCDCGVQPIYATEDPGQVIDILDDEGNFAGTLEDVHAAMQERFGAASASAREFSSIGDEVVVLVTHTHGEIGPVLGVRGQHFTGPADI